MTVVAGDTVRVAARVLDDRARPISDATVTWTSGDPTIATVDATGLVRALKEGHASITATSGPATATAPVAVHSADRATLMDLFERANGGDWTHSDNWASDQPVGTWYGVAANAESRVTALRLSENGLTGRLPENLGDLALLTELSVDGNALSGPIPVSLSQLPIQTFHYRGTMLCTWRDEGFRAWLAAIPTREGRFIACDEPRTHLETLYEAMGGPNWRHSGNWLTDAPLEDWYGIVVDGTGNVTEINLQGNNLSGEIPPEIGKFAQLKVLRLYSNELQGEIPSEIGSLGKLEQLWMGEDQLTGPLPASMGNLTSLREFLMYQTGIEGPIPEEFGALGELEYLFIFDTHLGGLLPESLGRLRNLRRIELDRNRLSGPLPGSLGALTKLESISLRDNRLSGPLPAVLGRMVNLGVLRVSGNLIEGPIPGELGQLRMLRMLNLQDNRLSGALPPELGDLGSSFLYLRVQNNPDLSGALPEDLTSLELVELMAHGTELCAPEAGLVRTWVESLPKYRIRPCGTGGKAEAYLTQAAQSREYPVPLVAGEEALLRVFVTSEQETAEAIPPVRTTFFVNGAEVHVAEIPGGSAAIPTEVQEGELDLSANALIPADVVQPGLEMIVEVDPDGTVDPNLGVSKRIPETGRATVDVRAVPPMYLTLVPFVWIGDNDDAAARLVASAEPDDDIFWETNNMLPVGTLEIGRHASVTVDSNDMIELLSRVEMARTLEGGFGHWMGLIPDPEGPRGIAYLGGKLSMSIPREDVMAHELGHNLYLSHADCGNVASPDEGFPYENARSGVWGYDPRDGSLVPPDRADLMSYCEPTWVSDYHFTNALRYRLRDTLEVWEPPAATRTLVVSGGVTSDGEPRLEPAFVVDTPPVRPDSVGPWRLTGTRADGGELFSVDFAMRELADGEGGAGFVLALPVQPKWATELASLSLSGPGGSVEMSRGSEPPLAILRDPVTGEVRAIFSDLSAGPLALSTVGARAPEPGLEVLVSSGLPDASAWRR